MNIAWLIFILFAYFGFEDPLKKRREKEKCVPLLILSFINLPTSSPVFCTNY